MKNYIYIETYGCAANQNNSEILAGILRSKGLQITNNEQIADIIIINSCIVKGKTENKIKRRIQDLKNSKKLLIITGCMPETDAEQLKKLNQDIILLGTHHFKEINNLILDYENKKLTDKKQKQYLENKNEEKINLPKIPKNKLISIIQISEGCLGKCTYCKTRLAKGNLFSYPEQEIMKSIKSDLEQGAKEIWITSQDCASYGLDNGKNKSKLPELLKKIISLDNRFKLRLGMMNPNNVSPILKELIEIYHSPKVYKFLHIPIQSASNNVLKHMKRFYTIEQAKEIIMRFRKEFPDITIATDIIIGYPTETREDFQKSLDFIEEYKPDVFNLSKMSIHKGTEIYNQIKKGKFKPRKINTINKRTTEIMKAHQKTALENKQKFLNKNTKVFVNQKISGNLWEARDDYYNIILLTNTNQNILGKNLVVKINQAGVHHLIGEII